MKIKTYALTIRSKITQEIVGVYPLINRDSKVWVKFPAHLIASMDALNAVLCECMNQKDLANALIDFSNGMDVYMKSEAQDVPSVSNAIVEIQCQEITWE